MSYWLSPLRQWGDYGAILIHGDAFPASESDADQLGVATGTIVLDACFPLSPVVLPSSFFICSAQVMEELRKIDSTLDFSQVYVRQAIEAPWRTWNPADPPRYPDSGEPVDYFIDFDQPDEFSPGLCPELWTLRIDESVPIAPPDFRNLKINDQSPILLAEMPNKSFVRGKVHERSRYGPLFCSDAIAVALQGVSEAIILKVLGPPR